MISMEINDSDLLLAFRKFLSRIADAWLARLYADAYPAGAHIVRNIRIAIKDSTLFSLDKVFCGLVLRLKGCSSFDHLPSFSLDELERCFHFASEKPRTIPVLLDVLHKILSDQSDHRQEVLLVDAVQLFKKYYSPTVPQDVEEKENVIVENPPEFEIEEICSQVETAVKEKIIVTYLSKGKLRQEEAQAILKAFQRYAPRLAKFGQ